MSPQASAQQGTPTINQPATVAGDIANLKGVIQQADRLLDRLKQAVALLERHHADTVSRLQ